jgi:hypothetical protein
VSAGLLSLRPFGVVCARPVGSCAAIPVVVLVDLGDPMLAADSQHLRAHLPTATQ